MPVLNPQGHCVGLIDAESWTPGFFDARRVGVIARCAMDLAAVLEYAGAAEPVGKKARLKSKALACGEVPDCGERHFVNGRLLRAPWS
mmetsp:Transcript_81986/g.228527  ORF Transcript_81986/g.228527 Transcript_81986/m.228527 type:complete len:88 (-) Transcript_81986:80-343(-)